MLAEEAETCERRDEEEDVVFSDGLELAPGVVWEAVMALGVTLARTDALYVVLGEWLGVLDICEVTCAVKSSVSRLFRSLAQTQVGGRVQWQAYLGTGLVWVCHRAAIHDACMRSSHTVPV